MPAPTNVKAHSRTTLSLRDAALRALGVPGDGEDTTAIRSLDQHASPAAKAVARQVRILAKNEETISAIVIEGESGTGKSLVSEALHDLSQRRSGPFVSCNLAGVLPELAASQLFGHRAGAFTGAIKKRVGDFEIANHGTIFLDEIGRCPLSVQSQLLGVIDHRRVRPLGSERELWLDVRIVAATSRPLMELQDEGLFINDLRERLSVGLMRLPPLRERRSDIPALVDEYVRHACNSKKRTKPPTVSPDFLDVCARYNWPGNLRELSAVVTRAMAESDGDAVLRPRHIPECMPAARAIQRRFRHVPNDEVVDTYHRCDRNLTRTAKLLGIHRSTVWSHLKKAGLESAL